MVKIFKNIYQYREMLITGVQRDIRSRYKGSFFGFLWTFINPLLQLAVYSLVFHFIVRMRVPGQNYTVFLFVGIVPWTNFAAALLVSSKIFVSNANLIKKVYFPRIILPLATVCSNIVNMLLTFIIVFPITWISGIAPSINYLFIPLLVLIQGLLMLGFGLIFSSIYVYFRDLEHWLNVILMAWMYLTPILYPPEYLRHRLFSIFKLNPMFGIIGAFRDVLLYRRTPDLLGLVYVLMFALVLITVGYMIYEKLQRRFAEEM